MTLNPLATPKGIKLLCEICQKPAHIQCTKCRMTYYCGSDHQSEDWSSIHEKVCSIVGVIRSPQAHSHSDEERQAIQHQQELRKEHVIEVSLEEGRRFLNQGQHSHAIPAALQALKMLTEVYGSTSINLTPAFLVLAEAAIGLNRLTEADQYLSQAQWSVLKAKDCEPWMKSKLHRNLGQLAAAKNCWPEAKKHFAEDIYQSSVAYSPDAYQTAGGYYHLGRVFLLEKKPDVAISLQDQVVSIWAKRLSALVQELLKQETGTTSQKLSIADRTEAKSMLHTIRELREEHTTSSAQLMVPVYHTLGMLHALVGERDKSRLYEERALELINGSGQSSFDDTRGDIETVLELLEKNTSDSSEHAVVM